MHKPISYFKELSVDITPVSNLMHSGFAHLITKYNEETDDIELRYEDYFVNLHEIRNEESTKDNIMTIVWETENLHTFYHKIKEGNLRVIREAQLILYDDTMWLYDDDKNNNRLHTARANHCSIPLCYYEKINYLYKKERNG